MSEIKVSLAGASGKLGSLILTELLNYPNVTVHALCRNRQKIPTELLSHPRVKVFEAGCNESNILQAAVRGTEVCICCYMGDATVLVDGQKTLIDACISEKVPRYIASDYSFDYRGFKFGDVPLMDFHFLVQSYLDEKEKQGLIKSVHILNGAFMEVFVNPFFGAYDGKSQTLRTSGTGEEVYELTTYGDTAKFTAAVALDSEANGFRGLFGDRKTAPEIAATYEKVYGHRLNIVSQGSTTELLDSAHTDMRLQPENFFIWVPKLLNYYMLNGSTLVRDVDGEKLQAVSPRNLENFFKSNSVDSLPTLVSIG